MNPTTQAASQPSQPASQAKLVSQQASQPASPASQAKAVKPASQSEPQARQPSASKPAS